MEETGRKEVRIGVIGAGNMGSTHIKSILAGKIPGLCLCAAADRRESRWEWLRGIVPENVDIYEEGSTLIADSGCDAVLIAVPHYQHPKLAIEAFAHGKHVMCEKPAGVYTKQVREMNSAARKSGLIFGMMFNQRTNCIYREMQRIVNSGEMGNLRRVNWIITNWYRTDAYYASGGWRATWDGEGGGVLLNQCPHQLDLLQWICGLPCAVHAFCHNGKWHDIEVEDDVTAYLEFPGGATGVFVTTTADAPGTNRLEITLDYGKLVCEDGVLRRWRLSENERVFCHTAQGGFDKPPVTEEIVQTDGQNPQHNGVLAAFTNRILYGTPLVAEGCEGIRGLLLSNAMHLSSWTGRTVVLGDPGKEASSVLSEAAKADDPLLFDEDLFFAELSKRRAHSRIKSDTGTVMDTAGTY